MDFKTKLTVFVDFEKVREKAKENEMEASRYIKKLYDNVRGDIYWLGATFDTFYLDTVDCDKVEIAFDKPQSIQTFLMTSSYRKLEEVCGKSRDIRKKQIEKAEDRV
jgi:hypothetical protein